MKAPSKPVLIAGGVAVAIAAIYFIKRKEKESEQETFYPTAPTTYYGSQEASGNFGNFGGGGVPSSGAPGVTTVPEPAEHQVCGPDEQSVGISAIKGRQGGIRCIPRNPPKPACPEGKQAVGIAALPGRPGGIRCV